MGVLCLDRLVHTSTTSTRVQLEIVSYKSTSIWRPKTGQKKIGKVITG